MAENIGGQASTPNVDDNYLRWQEDIRFAEEEAEALKAGKTHQYDKDFRKHPCAAIISSVLLCVQALFINMGSYLQGLFILADDTSPEVRKLVCV